MNKKPGVTRALSLLLTAIVSGSVIQTTPVSAGTQATYYASPAGSGSVCSLAAPCSLTGVRDKVRTANSSMTGDIIVYLRGGDYSLTSALTLDYRDSGTNGYRVYWKNYTGETPVISGGQSLAGGWTLHDAAKNIYKKTGVTTEFRSLYVNDLAAVRARTPNLSDADTLGSYYTAISADVTNKQYKINKAEIASWANLNQVEMVLQPHWYHNRLRVSSFTTDASYAYVSFLSPEQNSAFTKAASFYSANAYHFENAYELLDAEGEWYLNTATDTLYYKPRSGESMSTAAVVAPTLDVLVNLAGTAANPVHHLEINGLTFRYSGWNDISANGLVATQGASPITSLVVPGAVQAAYADQTRFIGNTLERLGGNGLKLGNSLKNSQIVGNTLRNIAANGIEVKSPNNASAADLSEHVLIGNNTITRIGQHITNGIGILAHFVSDAVIEHNDIYNTPYMGIQVGNQTGCNCNNGMSSNLIRYNELHHVMQLHDDGGAIYTLGRQPGTYIYKNYIHDLQKSAYALNYPLAALYMDNYSEFITAEQNVLTGINTSSGALLTNEQTGIGAQNNEWINNNTTDPVIQSGAGVMTGYTEPVSLKMNEAFDNATTGSAPSGWTVASGPGSVQAADVPSATDKSVLLSKMVSAGTTTAKRSISAVSGIVTASARVRAEQTGGWKMAPYVYDSAGTTAVSVIFEAGYIKTYNGATLTNLQTFTAGTWYNIQVVLDTNTDKFDLYIDGVKRINNASFRAAVADISGLSFGIGDAHTGSFYFDQVKLLAP